MRRIKVEARAATIIFIVWSVTMAIGSAAAAEIITIPIDTVVYGKDGAVKVIDPPGAGAERVAGVPGFRRGPPGEKVVGALRGRRVIAAAGFEEAPFQGLLKVHARERTGTVLLRPEGGDQRGVGPRRRVPRVTHAVGAQQAGRVRAGDDLPAGAHAERVAGRHAFTGLAYQVVVGGTQHGGLWPPAVAAAIDQFLGVLDPHTS